MHTGCYCIIVILLVFVIRLAYTFCLTSSLLRGVYIPCRLGTVMYVDTHISIIILLPNADVGTQVIKLNG